MFFGNHTSNTKLLVELSKPNTKLLENCIIAYVLAALQLCVRKLSISALLKSLLKIDSIDSNFSSLFCLPFCPLCFFLFENNDFCRNVYYFPTLQIFAALSTSAKIILRTLHQKVS